MWSATAAGARALPCAPAARLQGRALHLDAGVARLRPLAARRRRPRAAAVVARAEPAAARPAAQPRPQPQPASLLAAARRLAARASAAAALAAAALLATAAPAAAARSGGRIGGAAFGGRAAYGASLGGGFGGGGAAFGGRAPSAAYLGGAVAGSRAPAPLLYSPYGGAGGVRYSSFFISPFGFGVGYGMYGGGGGLLQLLFWGALAAIAANAVRATLAERSGGGGASAASYAGGDAVGDKVTVAKVQVGLLASARALQADLERLAATVDTSAPAGLHFLLQETVLALMRAPELCVYAYAKAGVEDSGSAGEARFNALSLEERSKFEKETLVNVGGRVRRAALGGGGGGGRAPGARELIVVTLLVAVEGRLRLPRATSLGELKAALAALGGVPARDTLAVEVLWTPEEEGDYFTQDDLAADYPLLNTL